MDAVAGTQGAVCQQFTLYDEAVTHWRRSISQGAISVLGRDSATPYLNTPIQSDTYFIVVKGYVPGIYAGANELVSATANTAGVLYFRVSSHVIALKVWRVLLTTNRVEILPRDYVASRAEVMRGHDLKNFISRSRWWHQPTVLDGDRHNQPFWVVAVGRAPGIYDSWYVLFYFHFSLFMVSFRASAHQQVHGVPDSRFLVASCLANAKAICSGLAYFAALQSRPHWTVSISELLDMCEQCEERRSTMQVQVYVDSESD